MLVTAREAGTPAIAGGAAFGPDESRAKRLGATAWAPTAASAVEQAAAAARFSAGAARMDTSDGDSRLIEANMGRIVHRLSKELRAASSDRQASAGLWMLRTLSAALLCDEFEILEGYLHWHERRRTHAGGVPARGILEVIGRSLPPEAAKAKMWVAQAQEASVGAA